MNRFRRVKPAAGFQSGAGLKLAVIWGVGLLLVLCSARILAEQICGNRGLETDDGQPAVVFYESGDLALRGEITEDAGESGSVPTVAGRDYIIVSDDEGNNLAAFEIYDPSSGVSSGNIDLLGTVTSQTAIQEPVAPDFFPRRFLNSQGETIAAIDLNGNLLVEGEVFTNDTDGIIWSAYLGDTGRDIPLALEIDASGCIYLAGDTESSDFPTSGAYDSTYNGGGDIFLAKFDPDGLLLWSTFFGGSDLDAAPGIALDDSSNVYLVGYTLSDETSESFPATGGKYQATYQGGGGDGFLAKFDSSGSFQWATYIGGSAVDSMQFVQVASDGDLIVLGASGSSGMATAGAYDETPDTTKNGYYEIDGFAIRLSSDGTTREWSTYAAVTTGDDYLKGIALDDSDNIYTATWHDIDDPATADENSDGEAGLLILSSDGSSGTWVTYDGAGYQRPTAVVLDESGNIYLSGITDDAEALTLYDTPLEAYHSDKDGFIIKHNTSGTLTWSTFFGESGDDRIWWMEVSDAGSLVITGDEHLGATCEKSLFVGQYNLSGAELELFSYGVAGVHQGKYLKQDPSGNIVTIGCSTPGIFPIVPGDYEQGQMGMHDGVILKLSINLPPSVDAGTDQLVTVFSATMDGTVSDDGLPQDPGSVTTLWTKVSGPGTVLFGNASDPDTTTTFSAKGDYVLKLTAYDGEYTSEDTVTIQVYGDVAPAAPQNLVAWGEVEAIQLDWDDVPEPYIAGYDIYRDSGGGFSKINGSLVTSSDYLDQTTMVGTTYTYKIKAVDDLTPTPRESDYSNTASAECLGECQSPHPPNWL